MKKHACHPRFQRGGKPATPVLSMQPRLQRRVQRYGWDLAAADYEPLWQAQLAVAHDELIARAALATGERVLDVACGSGLIAFRAAVAVGPCGRVVGVDLSGRMVGSAAQRAVQHKVRNVRFERMDAERLSLPDASFDVALCALGLMYLPDPEQAVREMRRVLRPGGRLVVAVWGERSRCAWSALFPIVDAEVTSDACPLFFRLGQGDMLARACADAQFEAVELRRVATTLTWANADAACRAAFVGGPVALAWSHFDEATRARVRRRYVEAIAAWRRHRGYRLPGEFVIVTATAPGDGQAINRSNEPG
jgi:SAM-dependent methyltransferase